MTEVKGGSDLGAAVETVAQRDGSKWRLTGDKYFASNAGAELAVVAARQEGPPQNVRGLSLYLVPRRGEDGQLNYLLCSPVQFLQQVGIFADQDWLRAYEAWFGREGQGISDAVDRAGTPWLRMFDRLGARVDEILYPPEYWRMLKHGIPGRRALASV